METDGFKHLLASCPFVMKEILDKIADARAGARWKFSWKVLYFALIASYQLSFLPFSVDFLSYMASVSSSYSELLFKTMVMIFSALLKFKKCSHCFFLQQEVLIISLLYLVCLPNNHVFYVVSTHEFFYTIELRSNSLHPPSTSNFLLPPDNHKSQDHRSTDPRITRNNFFLCKDKRTNHVDRAHADQAH